MNQRRTGCGVNRTQNPFLLDQFGLFPRKSKTSKKSPNHTSRTLNRRFFNFAEIIRMSYSNRGSSLSVNARQRYQGVGVEKRCWCGAVVVNLSSRSESNPRRRFLRCQFAADEHLVNDAHVFKWLDVGLLEECEALANWIGSLEEALSMGLDFTKQMGDDMLLETKLEARRGFKIMLMIVLVGFIVLFGLVMLV